MTSLNVIIRAFKEDKLLSEWLQDTRCKIKDPKVIRGRLVRGLTPEKAMTKRISKSEYDHYIVSHRDICQDIDAFDTEVKYIKNFADSKTRFLSNFYFSSVIYGGAIYPSVEHAFQAAKTLSKRDRERIRRAPSPGVAKKMGGKVRKRKGWDNMKLEVMEELVEQKFSREPFKSRLLATGNAILQEGNWWGDTFWGVDQKTGKGENNLGKILMRVRDKLRRKK